MNQRSTTRKDRPARHPAPGLPQGSREAADTALLAAAVRYSQDAIIITDTVLDEPGPRIIYVNPAFTRLTGYAPDEVIGKNPRILQGPKTDPEVLRDLRRTLERGEVFFGCTVNYRKDGGEFWMEWHIEPIREAAGRVTHYLGMQRDVSERKRMEAEVREKNAALEQKNIALKEILEQIEREKQAIKADVVMNVEEVLVPTLQKMRRRGTKLDRQYLDLLERSVRDLTSSFGTSVSGKRHKLSPREVEIANMVKNGLSSKEIADLLHISLKTVETHRNKIRKKLDVINQEVNLTSYLQSL